MKRRNFLKSLGLVMGIGIVPIKAIASIASTKEVNLSGTAIKFRHYAHLSPMVTPLVEGVTPRASKIVWDKVNFSNEDLFKHD